MDEPVEHPGEHKERHDEDCHQDRAQGRQKEPVFRGMAVRSFDGADE